MIRGCREIAGLLTEYQEGALPWTDRMRVKRHLGRCPECRGLLEDIGALPALVRRVETAPVDLASISQRALERALQELGRQRRPAPSPIPHPLQELLAAGADLPLRLLAQAHEALFRGEAPREEPFLPEAILSQLPSPETWKWTQAGQARRALLAVDPTGGQRLSLLFAPPNCQFPAHLHLGTESLLVLEGEMEDGSRCLTNGDWIHLEEGSTHAPCVLAGGCWCLVRDEGAIRFKGPFGWLRGLVA